MNLAKQTVNTALDWLFGCTHGNKSWPRGRDGKLYQVCLECGKTLPYEGELRVSNQ